MNETIKPSGAYELLEPQEKAAVDEYVTYAVDRQIKLRQRIAGAIDTPIPIEYIRRSKQALYKPLLRAAITERIMEIARDTDLSPDRVIEEHAQIAYSKITDFVEQGPYGEIVPKKINEWPANKVGAIKSIETKPGTFGLSVKITMHEKYQSLKIMGDLMGLVSPDNPPALRDYLGVKAKTEKLQQAPEAAYVELMESISPCSKS